MLVLLKPKVRGQQQSPVRSGMAGLGRQRERKLHTQVTLSFMSLTAHAMEPLPHLIPLAVEGCPLGPAYAYRGGKGQVQYQGELAQYVGTDH